MSSHKYLRTNPLISLPIILLIFVIALLLSCEGDRMIDPVQDREPPATTTDLAIDSLSSGSIRLNWTAPGDDSITGQAAQYDIRYSTSELDSSNWSSATSCTNPHTPAIAGTVESFAVTGLEPMTKYYFALRTSDESHNWSEVSNTISAKTPDTLIITWERTYGGPYQELLEEVVVAPDGGYVMAGQTSSYGSGYSDVYLVKVDEYGEIVWQTVYGGGKADDAWDVAITPDGGYITVGETGFNADFLLDALIVKFDAEGQVVWGRSYKGFEGYHDNSTYSICVAPSGGYLAAGATADFWSGDAPPGYFWLLRIDEAGDVMWQKFHDVDVGPFSTIAAPDGGFVIVGSGPYVQLLKVDDLGEIVWENILGAELNAFDSRCVIAAPGGGYVVGGYTRSVADVYVTKVDESGSTIWEMTYGGMESDLAYSVVATPDGGYILAGATKPPEAEYSDVYLIKVDGTGNLIWEKTYGSDNIDGAMSIAATPDGGYIIGARTLNPASSGDYYLLKVDAYGDL
ncbi:MAG: fibronectin type III domain-containing protein [candidate division Zixibacteria bacterium]|nr:fibronectin type III domain-containing protein [candidate division Zixibacteria bacterium]MBU1471507.1 fibronectin type III domain-containing protein [candidate division Zixibacteria bacterium]MBU2626538.1 fibronectin type III domain-containing protein [candidate division Zixibacteria bacterium]